MNLWCYNSSFSMHVAVTYSIVASYFSMQLFGESLSEKRKKLHATTTKGNVVIW